MLPQTQMEQRSWQYATIDRPGVHRIVQTRPNLLVEVRSIGARVFVLRHEDSLPASSFRSLSVHAYCGTGCWLVTRGYRANDEQTETPLMVPKGASLDYVLYFWNEAAQDITGRYMGIPLLTVGPTEMKVPVAAGTSRAYVAGASRELRGFADLGKLTALDTARGAAELAVAPLDQPIVLPEDFSWVDVGSYAASWDDIENDSVALMLARFRITPDSGENDPIYPWHGFILKMRAVPSEVVAVEGFDAPDLTQWWSVSYEGGQTPRVEKEGVVYNGGGMPLAVFSDSPWIVADPYNWRGLWKLQVRFNGNGAGGFAGGPYSITGLDVMTTPWPSTLGGHSRPAAFGGCWLPDDALQTTSAPEQVTLETPEGWNLEDELDNEFQHPGHR